MAEVKKRKHGEVEKNDSKSITSLKDFKVCKILKEDHAHRTLFVHCKHNEDDAVLLVEKTPFEAEKIEELLTEETELEETLKNDIYSTYKAFPAARINAVKTTMIYPATSKHIAKYTDQETFVIEETKELYQEITLPYINSQAFSVKWVYNILNKVTEADRIIYEDPSSDIGFILLPDMKWDRKDMNALYLQAIVHRHDIKSLRDLDQSHLPLLRNILKKGRNAIFEQYGIPASKLRTYLHYHPSYYHLHVHFSHIKSDNPGFEADRAVLLVDVIENIEMDSNYYQNKTLVFKVREQDKLYHDYKEHGYFNKN